MKASTTQILQLTQAIKAIPQEEWTLEQGLFINEVSSNQSTLTDGISYLAQKPELYSGLNLEEAASVLGMADNIIVAINLDRRSWGLDENGKPIVPIPNENNDLSIVNIVTGVSINDAEEEEDIGILEFIKQIKKIDRKELKEGLKNKGLGGLLGGLFGGGLVEDKT